MRRATILAEVDRPGEADAAEAWVEGARARLTHVSDQEGCGCCVLMWTVEGPEEVLATLPPGLLCDAPAPPKPALWHRLLGRGGTEGA